MSEGQWYYCLVHKAVEPYEKCKAENRLGPYAARHEAEEALERVAQRNKLWEDEDRRFSGEEADSVEWDGSGPVPDKFR